MFYTQPRFRPAGDSFIEVELGDEMSFDVNVRVHSLTASIRAAGIDGIVELVPELASMLVSYDPDRVTYERLVDEIRQCAEASGDDANDEMPSRLFYVPTLYFDPWTTECVEAYCRQHTEKVPDPLLLVSENGLKDIAELKRLHSGTEYWAAALGFWPGLCSLLPLDPRCRLNAPKYNPPRTWTPKGTIGVGGGLSCIYPDPTPGGYQIFARTPIPVWDREQRLAAFKESVALFQPGDRVRFVPIDREEYDDIEARVADGSYVHQMVDYQTFSVPRYRAWLQSLDPVTASDGTGPLQETVHV
ncbi:5-oxoprolinase subunit B family protein [Robbsia andropogonis]|uniref:5-oxoprolinase subunit B family protein n=1 Tax=Robbsia andropogonis TaxID=28092 RepID=UPI000466BF28|nr:carboxyltransferase domain-containing protein [Robbsia andropogonis]MCP1119416.1 carboxyltransferase domain-containing protein [Robbsia andropogonis]MCP1129399.1 carboxyltransferase domain-containing protein [Robbsia andropogonis]